MEILVAMRMSMTCAALLFFPRARGCAPRRGAGQPAVAGLTEAAHADRRRASSGASCRCAASSVTGSSKATARPRNGRPGEYRKEDDGGIIVDVPCHWRYALDNLFGGVQERVLPRRHPHPRAPRRERCASTGDRRRRCLCHLRARAGPHRALQQLVVRARAAAMTLLPSMSTAPVARPSLGLTAAGSEAARRDAEAGLESRLAADDRLLRDGSRCPRTVVYENAFKLEWELFRPARRRGRNVPLELARRRQGRASSRSSGCAAGPSGTWSTCGTGVRIRIRVRAGHGPPCQR